MDMKSRLAQLMDEINRAIERTEMKKMTRFCAIVRDEGKLYKGNVIHLNVGCSRR